MEKVALAQPLSRAIAHHLKALSSSSLLMCNSCGMIRPVKSYEVWTKNPSSRNRAGVCSEGGEFLVLKEVKSSKSFAKLKG